jgi:hypothetical protein
MPSPLAARSTEKVKSLYLFAFPTGRRCAAIAGPGPDRRSVVQNHLFEHISDHVTLRTALTDIVLKRIVSRRNCALLLQAHGPTGHCCRGQAPTQWPHPGPAWPALMTHQTGDCARLTG